VLVVMFTLFLLGQHVANSFSPSPIAVRVPLTRVPSLTPCLSVWLSGDSCAGGLVGRRVVQRLSGGLVGAAVGMMAEMGLFIIRTTRE